MVIEALASLVFETSGVALWDYSSDIGPFRTAIRIPSGRPDNGYCAPGSLDRNSTLSIYKADHMAGWVCLT